MQSPPVRIRTPSPQNQTATTQFSALPVIASFLQQTLPSVHCASSKMAEGKKHEEWEFGGPIGVTALMIWSHYILIYLW